MKKIMIIANKPRNKDDGDITEYVGKEFEVIAEDEEGYYIRDISNTGGDSYRIYTDEAVVTEEFFKTKTKKYLEELIRHCSEIVRENESFLEDGLDNPKWGPASGFSLGWKHGYDHGKLALAKQIYSALCEGDKE